MVFKVDGRGELDGKLKVDGFLSGLRGYDHGQNERPFDSKCQADPLVFANRLKSFRCRQIDRPV